MRKKLLITLALILQLAAVAVLLHRFLPAAPGDYIFIDGNRYAQYSPLLPPVGVWTVSQFQCGRSPSQVGY